MENGRIHATRSPRWRRRGSAGICPSLLPPASWSVQYVSQSNHLNLLGSEQERNGNHHTLVGREYHSRKRRNAFPRWLCCRFCSSVSSAKVLPSAGKKKSGSYPNPPSPRGVVSSSPGASPTKQASVFPSSAIAITHTYFPACFPGGKRSS